MILVSLRKIAVPPKVSELLFCTLSVNTEIVPELKLYVGPLSVKAKAVITVMLVNVPPVQVNPVPAATVVLKLAKSMVPAVTVKLAFESVASADVIVPAVLIAMALTDLPLHVIDPVPTMLTVAV